MNKQVIIDTDLNFPSDDFEALLLLLHAQNIDVVGIVATSGNTWREEVYVNCRRALRICNKDSIPVFLGRNKTHDSSVAWEIRANKRLRFIGAYEKHSTPCLTAEEELEVQQAQSFEHHFAEISTYLSSFSELTYVCLGPLTNLAQVLETRHSVKSVYAMGGLAEWQSRVSDELEFNLWFDLGAASDVFASKVEVNLIPREVCTTTWPLAKLISEREPLGTIESLISYDYELMNLRHGPNLPLWDQLVALCVVNPSIISSSHPVSFSAEAVDSANVTCRFDECLESSVNLVSRVDSELAASALNLVSFNREDKRLQKGSFFAAPHYHRFARERLREGSFKVLRSVINGDSELKLVEERDMDSPCDVLATFSQLMPLLIEAKKRGEIWPPCSRIDAIIREQDGNDIEFDHLALFEYEWEMFQRFIRVGWIAAIEDCDGKPVAFTCLSFLNDERKRKLSKQYNVALSDSALMTEFGIVDPSLRGKRAFGYMNSLLIARASYEENSPKSAQVYGIVLDTQRASYATCLSLGYQKIAERTVEAEQGEARRMHLLSRSLVTTGNNHLAI